ncbi:M4 family metallopeptidase [Photobacterium sp.]|uniref:M4 family metallopeptidase n=1 Tax=Photobacterium sp. TaxID=660 RepID=UPI00299F498F|nr:M4 family metallopeptidase [Photobacterium sp.]
MGTGPGGNDKTNRYDYGTDFGMLDVDVVGSTCTMNNTNVTTVDLNHGTNGSNTFTYTCPENTHKEINGAYSPLNDAHYFGGVVFNMFNDWLSESPLAAQNMPLTMRVHYSTNYENAFWDGSSMTFGDGYNRFYPLVSLDVTAHEVSHGFTEQHSNLIYSGQSGGINESFSDIAGEAAEFYMNGTADFQVGADIIKGTGALRYMQDPTLDGASIGHASDYVTGMDVHYSSGVYNRAFFILAAPASSQYPGNKGWGIRKAFELFAYTNKNIWTASETFDTAYEGLLAAADMLNTPTIPYDPDMYNKTDIIDAFQQVGVPKPPPGAVCSVDEPILSNGVPTGDFSANAGEWNCWKIDVAAGATNLDIVLRNTAKGRNKISGDADLYIKHASSPKVDPTGPTGEFDCGSYSSNSDERCTIGSPGVVEDGYWYIAIYAYSDVPSVSLTGTFDGGESQPPPADAITLTATVKGRSNKQFVSLNWAGATTTNVDIYRQDLYPNLPFRDTANDGTYKDNTGQSGYLYQVCESGTGNCSASVTAN